MVCLSLALLALGITLYPLISNYFAEVNRSLIETKYTKAVELMDDSEVIGARMDAQAYNATLLTVTDKPYTKEALTQAAESYDELLNRTLQWQTMDQPMYMDQDGELTTIAEIGVFAGAGRYKQLVRAFEHNINLVGDSNLIESCPKTARTGETVTILTYDITDGDKVIEVSGADVVRVNWIEYQFVMPPHDVDVKVKFIGNGLA